MVLESTSFTEVFSTNLTTGDGASYRDILIECNVVPALLARISPDTPVSPNVTRQDAFFFFFSNQAYLYFPWMTTLSWRVQASALNCFTNAERFKPRLTCAGRKYLLLTSRPKHSSYKITLPINIALNIFKFKVDNLGIEQCLFFFFFIPHIPLVDVHTFPIVNIDYGTDSGVACIALSP